MILVADAADLIALAACNCLQLFDVIFGTIVPDAVFMEVTYSVKPQSDRLKSYLQEKVRVVNTQNIVHLDAFADAGETAAMLLYREVGANYLLIDDKRGCKIAQIKSIGSLGVLFKAKRLSLIDCVAPLITQIDASPVFMGDALSKLVIELAGEVNHKNAFQNPSIKHIRI